MPHRDHTALGAALAVCLAVAARGLPRIPRRIHRRFAR